MTDAEKLMELRKVIGNINYILSKELTPIAIQNLKAYIIRIMQSDLTG